MGLFSPELLYNNGNNTFMYEKTVDIILNELINYDREIENV